MKTIAAAIRACRMVIAVWHVHTSKFEQPSLYVMCIDNETDATHEFYF